MEKAHHEHKKSAGIEKTNMWLKVLRTQFAHWSAMIEKKACDDKVK